ncbi:MAG TPA: DUF6508 domain-containing protein [Anditalea sp.]|nr:DUF6508 domain-containing protein [Anditalea sp.]
MEKDQTKMHFHPSNSQVEVVDFSFHWLCLKKEDFTNVLNYIVLMEAQFGKAEELLARDKKDEANEHYYNFDDLKWALYKDLAFLGLVTDTEWVNFLELQDMLENPDQFNELDYLTLCKVLAISTSGTHFSDGYFDRKIKNKTILKLLKSLDKAIERRDNT